MSYISRNSTFFWAFNIWDTESAFGVLDAAVFCNQHVILQTSPKAFSQMDRESVRFYVSRFTEKTGIQAYLHLDHCRELQMIEDAIASGWDSLMIDASDTSLQENIRITNEVCDMAKEKKIPVEAEVGRIQGVEDDLVERNENIASIDDIKLFLKETRVQLLAAAVGTAHGIYQGAPRIHYDLIEEIGKVTNVPLVIHGGSGLLDEELCRLLSYPHIKKINISTEVKLAYRNGILRYEDIKADTFNPLKMKELIHSEIKNMAIHKLQLKGNRGLGGGQ